MGNMKPGAPPDVIAAAREGGSRKGPRESITNRATQKVYPNTRPFAVAIIFFGRAKTWGRYATAAAADAEVAKLRKLKFHAERLVQ
jgi:hypothetical protein